MLLDVVVIEDSLMVHGLVAESIIRQTNQNSFLGIVSAFAGRGCIVDAHQSLMLPLEVTVVEACLLELIDLVQDLVRLLEVLDFSHRDTALKYGQIRNDVQPRC